MSKFRILVDMDGIVADLLPYWLDCIYRDHGVRAYENQIDKWDMEKTEVLKSLMPSTIFGYLGLEGFFRDVPVVKGAVEGVKALVDAGHEVLIASTATTPVAAKEKLEWLREHMPMVNKKNVFITTDSRLKTMINADVLIDDHPQTLADYARGDTRRICVGLKYAYNRGLYKEYFDFNRPVLVDNWQEILDVIGAQAKIPQPLPIG